MIGDTGKINIADLMRRKAMKIYNEDRLLAIQMGLTDEDGNVLDRRDPSSPNYKKPLPEKILIRRLFLIVQRDHGWKRGRLTLSQDRVDIDTDLFTPSEFRAIVKKENGEIVLNSSKYTQFKTIETDWNISDLVKTHIPMETIRTLDSYHQENSKNPFRIVGVEGIVRRIMLPSPYTNQRMFILIDPEEIGSLSLRCFLHEEYKLDFTEYSKVIAIGKTRRIRDDIVLDVYGVYVYPEYRSIRETTQIDLDDILGWK